MNGQNALSPSINRRHATQRMSTDITSPVGTSRHLKQLVSYSMQQPMYTGSWFGPITQLNKNVACRTDGRNLWWTFTYRKMFPTKPKPKQPHRI